MSSANMTSNDGKDAHSQSDNVTVNDGKDSHIHCEDKTANDGKDSDTHSHTARPAKRRKTDTRLPVVVLTGYLGAGKTTLLNYILHEQRDKKLAVIENEIGEVSIDDALVEQKQETAAEEVITLDNGCVCCTIRGDLEKTLKDLARRRREGLVLDGVLVELTGAADPAPVVQTFMMSAAVEKAFYVDNVITLVDAKHAIAKLDESKRNPDDKGTATAQIAFSSTVLLNKVDLVDESVLKEIEQRVKVINSVVDIIRCEQARVPMGKLVNVKAFDLSKVLEEQYMDEDEFNQFYRPKMDTSISNVGIKCEGAVCIHALSQFLDKYLEEEETAKDFMRIKGVIHIKGSARMWVLQCVHMIRDESFTKLWKKAEKRENRIIFIGRGMQQRRQELTDGFTACLAKPLRFEVGARVRAKMKDGDTDDCYEFGTIVKHWDECMAYRIKLESGTHVHAPLDTEEFLTGP